MRKTLSVLVVLGLVFGAFALPAEAKKKKKKQPRIERVVEIDYQAPGLGVSTPGPGGGICPFADPTTQECIEIAPALEERYIKVEIDDATGMSVAGYISQGDTDGDGIGDLYGDFCGAHEEPIALQAVGAPVRISFYNGTCADGTPSVATTGTITVTFSNKP
jgi:hypothetical protein